jgi:hypothetical protein
MFWTQRPASKLLASPTIATTSAAEATFSGA